MTSTEKKPKSFYSCPCCGGQLRAPLDRRGKRTDLWVHTGTGNGHSLPEGVLYSQAEETDTVLPLECP